MILISIGANLPGHDGTPPLGSCRKAAANLDGLLGLRLRGLSNWYETAPIVLPDQDPAAQPSYINGVVGLEPSGGAGIDPAALLDGLMRLESLAGRVRGATNAPRVLDLDIVAIDDMVRDWPDPILPHPRAHQRAFVLVPVAEVAPGWVHPRLGLNLQTMISRLPPQGIRRIQGRKRPHTA